MTLLDLLGFQNLEKIYTKEVDLEQYKNQTDSYKDESYQNK